LVSFITYANLTEGRPLKLAYSPEGRIKSARDVPLGRFLLKIPPGLEKKQREELRNSLEVAAGGHGILHPL
jgi:hypothetical protein